MLGAIALLGAPSFAAAAAVQPSAGADEVGQSMVDTAVRLLKEQAAAATR